MKTVEFYAKPRIVGKGSIGITLPNRDLDRINAIPKKLLEQWVKFVAEVPDAAGFYPQAMRKVFSSNARQTTYHGEERVEHRINNVHKTGRHNVRIETVFSKIKDRVDDFRGLKALWSAPILMQGIILQHNFIEAHTTTGKIPAEIAGIKLETGQNRWLGLIKLSSL